MELVCSPPLKFFFFHYCFCQNTLWNIQEPQLSSSKLCPSEFPLKVTWTEMWSFFNCNRFLVKARSTSCQFLLVYQFQWKKLNWCNATNKLQQLTSPTYFVYKTLVVTVCKLYKKGILLTLMWLSTVYLKKKIPQRDELSISTKSDINI